MSRFTFSKPTRLPGVATATRPLPSLRLRPPRHARPLPRVRYNRANRRRPMKRRLINLLTLVSLVLCVATCVLWGWSYRAGDDWKCVQPWADYRVESCSGQIAWTETYFGNIDRSFLQPPEYGVWHHRSETPPLPPIGMRLNSIAPLPHGWFNQAGFTVGLSLTDAYINSAGPTRMVAVPYWAAFVMLGILPALSALRHTRRRRRQSRQRHGACPACGYDLRATPGRCPECGTIAPSAVAP
jgi:hypothetical protein